MPNLTITCPSGLRGVVRPLKGREIDMFANREAIRKGQISSKILNACWTETLEMGPAYPGLEKPDWNKVLIADSFYALLMTRCATFGSAYEFQVQCTEHSCRRRFQWGLDIMEDLQVKPMPEESIELFANGNRFTAEIADHEVTFKLLVGADQAKLTNLDNKVTAALRSRIVSVSGVDPMDTRRWLEDLDFGYACDIIAAFEEHDGGVETDIEVECPHCGNIMDVALPLDQLFTPPKKRR